MLSWLFGGHKESAEERAARIKREKFEKWAAECDARNNHSKFERILGDMICESVMVGFGKDPAKAGSDFRKRNGLE